MTDYRQTDRLYIHIQNRQTTERLHTTDRLQMEQQTIYKHGQQTDDNQTDRQTDRQTDIIDINMDKLQMTEYRQIENACIEVT